MKIIQLLFILSIFTSCEFSTTTTKTTTSTEAETSQPPVNTEEARENIDTVLEKWHKAAAEAQFDPYFELMARDGVFIGTDATENWQNQEFRDFSKPYFDKGKAWSFSTIERNIYISENNQTAWFDELLNTQMGICRGSGVLELVDNNWIIKHYILSIAIPNENVTEIVEIKKDFDSSFIAKFDK
ncbi:nuclear transport factor 2 family protein [Antarcticibacterium arcticum]|uniref:Nuclear transport factor 2 family protein n=1 Tax=Antarcticibacterium arcticum TaxID=2585771 RepID=A0A5B8YQL0_9FLAO|nr:nuclear transport factor 2 family protein [Antarcticibacterium arcticum]QED38706.1 nuclear transport factor 2 family protein [Antarcticibacterium arcticum]